MIAKNTEGKTIQSKPEIELGSLDEALELAHEMVLLRSQLESTRRDHLRLLEQREESLSEGIDLLPEIRVKHLEIQNLTPEIAQLEQRIQWLVGECVAKLNAETSQISGREYIKSRDNLRRAAERFRVDLAAVIREMEASANLGPSLTDSHNSKLAEIEKLLGGVHFPRVMYRLLPLPPLDAELVRRNQILAAFDRWIAGLW